LYSVGGGEVEVSWVEDGADRHDCAYLPLDSG
jgi:hypothetical protein